MGSKVYLVIFLIRSPLLLLISMIQEYRVQILGIFFFSLYLSWFSTGSIWLLLRAMRQPPKGCQRHYCYYLITDLGSQWQTYFCDYARVLDLVFQRMENHHHHRFFSKYVTTFFVTCSFTGSISHGKTFSLLPPDPMQRLLKEACTNDEGLFSAFLNRLFNTLSWTMTEFSVSVREMQEKYQVWISFSSFIGFAAWLAFYGSVWLFWWL